MPLEFRVVVMVKEVRNEEAAEALGGITTHFRTGGLAYRFPKIVENHRRAQPFPYANYLAEWHQVSADQGRMKGNCSGFPQPLFFHHPLLSTGEGIFPANSQRLLPEVFYVRRHSLSATFAGGLCSCINVTSTYVNYKIKLLRKVI